MGNDHLRTVSLCSGIGGLERGIPLSEPAVFAENNPLPSRILATRWPDVPNVGDWTQMDSLDVWAPELVTAGLPCQSVSRAGANRGDKDERWLYYELVRLLERSKVRPVLFLENVPDIQTRQHRTALRKFFCGLESLGYEANTTIVPAASVGAPHLRRRWWCLAVHSDNPRDLPPPEVEVTNHKNALLPTPIGEHQIRELSYALLGCGFTSVLAKRGYLLPTPIVGDSGGATNENTLSGRLIGAPPCRKDYAVPALVDEMGRVAPDGWGKYQPAIDLWSSLLGRRPPVQIQMKGLMQVNARMVEWMMGFPKGWASDILSNRQSLMVLGNAVLPHQASLSARRLVSSPKLF